MSSDDLNKKVLEITEVRNNVFVHIEQLVAAMVDIDEAAFEKILNNLILRNGFVKTVTEIIYPFLERIGILWQTQNITPAHEHFISNLIRQKVIVAIDGLQLPPKTARCVLLFLPEGELHEIGLLFYHYLVRQAGYRTYYLGQSVPHGDLKAVFAQHKPDFLVTSITTSTAGPVEDYLRLLCRDFPDTPVYVSGQQVQAHISHDFGQLRIFSSALELASHL
jgi:methanogenic corrinoid protein MtbC1